MGLRKGLHREYWKKLANIGNSQSNSTNGFIYYGKQGEIATNRRDGQEMGLLCLHLLQASMVYINTLMIQQVLNEPVWSDRMTTRDLAALSPLITQHINPYGRFDLDMDVRLPLDEHEYSALV